MTKAYSKSLLMKTCIFVIHKTDNGCSLHYLTHIVSKTVVIFYSYYPNDSVIFTTTGLRSYATMLPMFILSTNDFCNGIKFCFDFYKT